MDNASLFLCTSRRGGMAPYVHVAPPACSLPFFKATIHAFPRLHLSVSTFIVLVNKTSTMTHSSSRLPRSRGNRDSKIGYRVEKFFLTLGQTPPCIRNFNPETPLTEVWPHTVFRAVIFGKIATLPVRSWNHIWFTLWPLLGAAHDDTNADLDNNLSPNVRAWTNNADMIVNLSEYYRYPEYLVAPDSSEFAPPLGPTTPETSILRMASSRPLYSDTPETTTPGLEWSELVTLDLSTFDAPRGKEALAEQLKYAVHNVKNFGVSQEDVDRQFAVTKRSSSFLWEKLKYKANHAAASYNGYNGPHVYDPDTKDHHPSKNIEFTPHFPPASSHPQLIQDNRDAITSFGKRIHTNVIERLLVIFAVVLELEDHDYFVKRHLYDVKGEDHMRYMLYCARSDEVNEDAGGLYSTGHTDLGSITLLFRQPIAGLQVLHKDGKYRWVKASPGTITINIADTLSLLSGRYLKSSIHRVSIPPPDQRHLDRHGVLFFIRPNNNVKVEVVKNSPLLQREGVYDTLEELAEPIDVETWVRKRQEHIFQEGYKISSASSGPEGEGQERADLEAIVAGVKVKYWN
ncbi:hypothetical protein DFH09DRAFT_1327378 [Mycena vulgaris]|nr:hypothetical protein DFH09DRAFT_1327378 [Mycena vulgaris]